MLITTALVSFIVHSVDVQGYWEHQSSFSTGEETNFSQRPEFQLEFDATSERLSFNSEYRYRYDWNQNIGVEGEWDLREFYVEILALESLRVKIGQQIVIWGIFDEFSANDYLNSEDYRYFLTDERAERKQAVPMLEINWLFDQGEQEVSFYFLPLFKESRLPPLDSPWKAQAQVAAQETKSREWAPENHQYGLRYLSHSETGDFGIYLYHGFDSQPAYEIIPPGEVVASFERFSAGGFSLSLPIQDNILKTEVSIRSSSARETELGVLRKSPELRSNFGWETFALSPIWVEIDFFFTNYLQKEEKSLRDPWTGIVLLQTRSTWLQEDLELSVRYAFDLQHPGHFFHGEATYRWNPMLRSSLGTYLFAGENKGIFGQYRDNDQIYFSGRLSF